jgi:hypothetical protein
MERLKSIDIVRGLSMCWMFLGHLQGWWLRQEDLWLALYTNVIVEVIGVSAFVFIAGVSTTLSYRSRLIKAELDENYDKKSVRNEYLFRTLFIFLIAILYNLSIAIVLMDFKWIWSWFVLLTVAICLFFAWPILSKPKWFRITLGISVWIINIFILDFLFNFQGENNISGIVYHLLYHPLGLDTAMIFFTFFLIGTVIGDLIFDIFQIEDSSVRKKNIKNRILIPSMITGTILILLAILLPFPYQSNIFYGGYFDIIFRFLVRNSFLWSLYALGFLLIFFSLLLSIEVFEVVKPKKSYKFLFYFSYYSFTIYLIHNVLYFLFYQQLNVVNSWFFIGGIIVIWVLIFRALYKSKWRNYISLKFAIGKISSKLVKRKNSNKK